MEPNTTPTPESRISAPELPAPKVDTPNALGRSTTERIVGEVKQSSVNRQPSLSGQALQDDQQDPQVVGPQADAQAAQPVAPDSTQQKVQSPVVASDVDVIEKEWVDKAKNVVESTKKDPYQQEKQVSQLQADYLNKRFGKNIKVPKS